MILGRQQQSWRMKSRTCRQVKREEAAVRRSPRGAALIRTCWSVSTQREQPRHCSGSRILREKLAEHMAVHNLPEPTAPERGAGTR